MNPQLAFIGIGNMGRGMCRNLVYKGDLTNPLLIFNRTTKRATDLQATLPAGSIVVARSAQETVRSSDIIFMCLGDDDAVQETLEAALVEDLRGKILVDCSTIHPVRTDMLADLVGRVGAVFVACPVFGAPEMADSGQLVCVLAGPKAAVEQIRPYCKGVMGRAEIDLGNLSPGAATTLKVIGNSFIFNMVETIAEGHVLAEKSGFGGEKLHQYIEAFFPGPYISYSKRMMSVPPPLFLAELARKDARHAMSLAKSVGVKLEALEVAENHLAAVENARGAKGDYVGIYGVVRQKCGLAYENDVETIR